jgi:hypothetical protein
MRIVVTGVGVQKSHEKYNKMGLCICGKEPISIHAKIFGEKCLQAHKDKYQEAKIRLKAENKCLNCWTNIRVDNKNYCQDCIDKRKEYQAVRHNLLKGIIFNHYGGFKCACCGETNPLFLSMDHINGGGTKHRREGKLRNSNLFYRWLMKNNYPEGFQVLCMNCNWGKRMNNGVCPHKLEKNNGEQEA